MDKFNKNQDAAIDFALDRAGSAWFMPPGMGKTRAWLETINETTGRTLVVAPKTVCLDTWPRENKKWNYNFPMRFLHGRHKHLRGREHVSLINYEALPWLAEKLQDMDKCPWEYVIYDELSKLKNVDTKRFRKWLKVMHKFKYRNGGTGTPVGNHLKDLFGEVLVCDLGDTFVPSQVINAESVDMAYRKFVRRYFDENEYTKKLEPWDGAVEEILDRVSNVAISFDINDLDMPPLKHNPIYLDLPSNVVDYYVELQNSSVIDDLDVYAMNAAVKSGKKRQLASGAVYNKQKELVYLHDVKAERLKNIVEELQGNPVMVFFEFIHDYESICKTLGPVPALYGQTKPKEVPGLVKKWNAGQIPVLAVHPRSAAYGLNMQDSGHVCVFYTVPWSYEMINQGIARIWRQGQKNKVICHYLIVQNTEDERVYLATEAKKGVHEEVMKGLLL